MKKNRKPIVARWKPVTPTVGMVFKWGIVPGKVAFTRTVEDIKDGYVFCNGARLWCTVDTFRKESTIGVIEVVSR